MAPACRWLSIVNGRRLIQAQNATKGRRKKILEVLGRARFEVGSAKMGKASVFRIPKTVFGPTMVLRSVNVNSHIEYKWYCHD